MHTWPFNTSATERHTWQPVARMPSWRGTTGACCAWKCLHVTMERNSSSMKGNNALRPSIYMFHSHCKPLVSNQTYVLPRKKLKQILSMHPVCARIQKCCNIFGNLAGPSHAFALLLLSGHELHAPALTPSFLKLLR